MEKLQNLSGINTNTIEGRYLMAALVKLTTESQIDKSPDEVLDQCYEVAEKMYEAVGDLPTPTERGTFEQELTTLINQHSKENGSDTPDFILSEYLNSCLLIYNKTLKARDKWFGVESMWNKTK